MSDIVSIFPNYRPNADDTGDAPRMDPDADADTTDAGNATQRPLLADGIDRRDYGAAGAAEGSSAPPAVRGAATFARNLGALEAFGIVISIVIGSGVFTSPGAIDANVPSPGAALLVWFVGGILAWTGASTLAELGTAIPGEGGVQPYLQYIFGDVFGFLAAWTWVVAVMPATLAILSIVFVETIYSAAGVTDLAGNPVHKLLSVLVLVAVSVANCISTKASTRLNSFFVLVKFGTISAVVVTALVVVFIQLAKPQADDVGGRDWFSRPWFRYRKSVNPDGSTTDWTKITDWELFGHYAAALYGALWAYSGWDKAIYVSAELSSRAKQLPLAINTAIPTTVLCFLAANTAYYILLPWNVVSTTDSVAVTAISRLLGPAAGMIAAVLICLVVAGSLLGNSFVAGRMAVAAARKGWLPLPLARIGTSFRQDASAAKDEPRSDAPINAIILSAALGAVYVALGSFRALLTFNGLGEYSFFLLTVSGALLLRYREPDLRRPYKPWLLVPATFALVSALVVVRGAVFSPWQAGILAALWLVGLVFYFSRTIWMAGIGPASSDEGQRS